MVVRRLCWGVLGVVCAVIVAPAQAAVICSKRSGVLVVRDACKKKESPVNLASLGALGPKGDKGDKGDTGDPGPFPDPLQSGKTLRGVYHVEGSNAGSAYLGNSVAYGFTLPSVPTIHLINDGGTPPAECPGTVEAPAAAPGHLCVYEGSNHQNNSNELFLDFSVTNSGKFGFFMNVTSVSTGNFWSLGTWAVTAP